MEKIKLLFDLFIEAVIIIGWLYLVYVGKAGVEGFIVVAVYIVKKKYDMKENGK